MPQKVRRRVRIKKLPLLIIFTLILVVIISLIAIFIGFYKEKKSAPPNVGLVGIPPAASSEATLAPPQASVNEPGDSSNVNGAVGSDGGDSEKTKATKEVKVDTIVPQTVAVDDVYFKDALFIGDSISKGFKLWVAPYSNNVIADQNVGLDQIFNNKDVYYATPDNKTTLWNAIEERLPSPAKIYILLGTNGIPGYDNNKHIGFYKDLVIKLKKKYPEAIIYIESLTPITKEVSDDRAPAFTKKKIDEFNQMLLKLAQENGVYYLKIEDVLKDENGYLKAAYDAGDGTHMPKDGHVAVFKYIKEHIVSADGFATVYGGE